MEFSFGCEVVFILVINDELGEMCNVKSVVVVSGVEKGMQACFDKVVWIDVVKDVLDGFVVEEFVCVNE